MGCTCASKDYMVSAGWHAGGSSGLCGSMAANKLSDGDVLAKLLKSTGVTYSARKLSRGRLPQELVVCITNESPARHHAYAPRRIALQATWLAKPRAASSTSPDGVQRGLDISRRGRKYPHDAVAGHMARSSFGYKIPWLAPRHTPQSVARARATVLRRTG